jgi:chemotaxis protein CheX
METIEYQNIVKIIEAATDSVFSTMLNLPADPQPMRRESGDPAPVDGITAMVGIGGTWTGMGQIQCSAEFARQLAGALLMTEYATVDAEVLDAIAELTNMIIGNVKTHLEERLGPLGLGIPAVIYGRNYQARTGGAHDWTVVPFRSNGETMVIRFCLMPTPTATRMHPARPEPAHA